MIPGEAENLLQVGEDPSGYFVSVLRFNLLAGILLFQFAVFDWCKFLLFVHAMPPLTVGEVNTEYPCA